MWTSPSGFKADYKVLKGSRRCYGRGPLNSNGFPCSFRQIRALEDLLEILNCSRKTARVKSCDRRLFILKDLLRLSFRFGINFRGTFRHSRGI